MNRIETLNILNGEILHKDILPINTPSDYSNHFDGLLTYLSDRVNENWFKPGKPVLDRKTVNGLDLLGFHSDNFSMLVSKTWIAWKEGGVLTISGVVKD